MEWTGGCLCGALRYRASADPIRAVNCHCATCRRSSGAAFMTFVHFPASAFAWTSGEPKRYRSSNEAERGFCPVCGSTLSMHEAVLPDRVQVSLGSLDRPDLVRPHDHVWTSSQLPWLEVVDDLPRYPTVSAAVPSRALDGDDDR
ncbi:MAG: GFA family protein [Geminicoccaceae bacterium]